MSNIQNLWPTLLGHYPGLPASLVDELQRFINELPDDLECSFVKSPEQQNQLMRVLIASPFVRQQVKRFPELLTTFYHSKNYSISRDAQKQQLADALNQQLKACDSIEALHKELRVFRNQFMANIIFRDLNRVMNTMQVTMQLSLLAEVCLQTALEFHYPILASRYGTPRDTEGKQQSMLILGMGKLGAWELNLSSDIDLIFAYPSAGETDHAKKPISNQEFFSHLGKAIIQSLDKTTVDGFVFRVDMRLRPWGESGALVSNFDALENYYQTQGREWERYAMIKARVVALNDQNGDSEELMAMLHKFTYRQYVDFSVIEALRGLKQMINEEVRRKKLFEDVKRGNGGIREVEFIVQVFQLIRGGKDRQLRDNRLLVILPALVELGCIPETAATALRDAYLFLRNTEHAIQGYKDQQTQKLPETPEHQLCLAIAMGFRDWDSFYRALSRHRERVSKEFHEVIASPDEKSEQSKNDVWQLVWQAPQNPDIRSRLFAAYENPEAVINLLQELKHSNIVVAMQPEGRTRLDSFMPRLLAACLATDSPLTTLQRLFPLVKSVLRRSAYLLLLIENPGGLEQLVTLAAASPWIADQLARHPALLDELLDIRTLYHAPNRAELEEELSRYMQHIDSDDLEAQMEHLRYFRSAHALRVAACEVAEILPLMKVSDYLTFLAETILEYVLGLAWREMTLKYGFPDGDERTTPNFLIIGYGKVGGIELGHSSDLDLVFLHNASLLGSTDGAKRNVKELDNQTFYTRLGQKIIHILNTKTVSGQLYEIDMRLRPSGNSGLLVTSLSSFEKYQNQNAWTWEHQALVRARPLVGDSALANEFNRVRKSTLQKLRDNKQLIKDVKEMRQKMRSHLGNDKSGDGSKAFNLKQDSGGIVDIEFMVQYAVLAWSHNNPGLTTYTDNIRILESLEQSKMLSTQEVEQLTEAYKAFRSIGHRLALQQLPNLVDGNSLNTERKTVSQVWRKLLEA